MNEQIHSYKDLIVWQKSMDLAVAVYILTGFYPKEELYGLVSQSRRCAVSIPGNIAEGRRRTSRAELARFLTIAYSSGAELETQIELVKRLAFGEKLNYTNVDALLDEVMRMLNTMIGNLKS